MFVFYKFLLRLTRRAISDVGRLMTMYSMIDVATARPYLSGVSGFTERSSTVCAKLNEGLRTM